MPTRPATTANAYWGVYQPAAGLPNGDRAAAAITTSAGGAVVSIVNEQAPTSLMSYDG